MMHEGLKYKDITGKVIGAAMEVHRTLGNGFQEVIYQRAMEIELAAINLEYKREFTMHIYYKGNHIGKRRVDFLLKNN
jgi:GxxExxY protein